MEFLAVFSGRSISLECQNVILYSWYWHVLIILLPLAFSGLYLGQCFDMFWGLVKRMLDMWHVLKSVIKFPAEAEDHHVTRTTRTLKLRRLSISANVASTPCPKFPNVLQFVRTCPHLSEPVKRRQDHLGWMLWREPVKWPKNLPWTWKQSAWKKQEQGRGADSMRKQEEIWGRYGRLSGRSRKIEEGVSSCFFSSCHVRNDGRAAEWSSGDIRGLGREAGPRFHPRCASSCLLIIRLSSRFY